MQRRNLKDEVPAIQFVNRETLSIVREYRRRILVEESRYKRDSLL